MSALHGKVSSGPTGFDAYGNKKYLHGTREFLQSNTIIAKLAFVLLVIFLFIIFLRLGTALLSYFL